MRNFFRFPEITSALIMFLFIFGCGQEAKITEDIKIEFGTFLGDPESLQLRNVIFYGDGTVCGEYNSKNKMGGYAGFMGFIFNKKGVLPKVSDYKMFSREFSTVKLIVNDEMNRINEDVRLLWCSDRQDYENKIYVHKSRVIERLLDEFSESKSATDLLDCNRARLNLDVAIANSKKPNSFGGSLTFMHLSADMSCDKLEQRKKDRATLLTYRASLRSPATSKAN